MLQKNITVVKAILIGQLMVNLPVVLIILGCGIAASYMDRSFKAGLLIGCLLAWLYWSFMIPRWRKWAINNGVNQDALSKWGQWTLLTWKKGSIFEKTEMNPNKNGKG